VERTEDFAPALARAQGERGVRLLHLKTDVEQITSATTISKIRARSR
jgi:acetolactate synthase-1/2/3 large subunit